jgi:hypothetical protein
VAGLVLMAALFAAPQAAMAWKPFTHNFIGDQVWPQASKGKIIVGRSAYPINPDVAAALLAHQASYNAGVVGPDGFPDIAYGQSQIHPNHTGKWLSYLMRQARTAQTATKRDPKTGKLVTKYSAREKGQILAFSYGYLTHAAGDMWGHTLINDFARGLFPSFGEFEERDKAKIALRHIVAESYVGSATPGWDRAQGKRRQICATYTPRKTGCDVSDDTTHRVRFNAPTNFIYDVFVDPKNPLPVGVCGDRKDDDGDGVIDDGCPGQAFTAGKKGEDPVPEPQRGPLLDYFLNLQANLELELARRKSNARYHLCSTTGPNCNAKTVSIPVSTVRGNKKILVTRRTCDGTLCFPDVSSFSDETRAQYLAEWIRDIGEGLKNWGSFSLQVTKALFDPQARRDAQNNACHSRGDEDDEPRETCENGIGALDTIDYKTADYVNHFLFEMLGAPEIAGKAREELNALADEIDDWIGPLLNPLRWVADEVKDVIATLLKETIKEATGLDVDEIRRFVTHPELWMCGSGKPSIGLGKAGTFGPSSLFKGPAEHQRLDRIMGLAANHHQGSDCQPLKETASFPINSFAAMKSSIAQASMLLLDGKQLNLALGDVLAQARIIQNRTFVHTYPADGNVMYTPLQTVSPPVNPAPAPWLDLIDGDHSWRSDGLPRFCRDFCSGLYGLIDYPLPSITQSGKAVSAGGTGAYPPWESCVLRPAFRALFSDWENDANTQRNFPDLGDATSPDPASDPNPPSITITPIGVTTTVNGVRTVLPGGRFQPIGHDDFFTESQVKLSYRIYAAGTAPGGFQPVPNRGSFSLPGGALVGNWVVEVRAEDPCGSSAKAETFSVV